MGTHDAGKFDTATEKCVQDGGCDDRSAPERAENSSVSQFTNCRLSRGEQSSRVLGKVSALTRGVELCRTWPVRAA